MGSMVVDDTGTSTALDSNSKQSRSNAKGIYKDSSTGCNAGREGTFIWDQDRL